MLGFVETLFSSVFFLISYVSNSNAFPKPLSDEEEKEYLEKMKTGDIEARNKLIEHNLRLVAHIVKKYAKTQEEGEELISIGTIGLIKGIMSYDNKKGTRLATYAARCIENSILTQRKHLIIKKYLLQENGIYIVKLMKNCIYSTEIRVVV